MKHWRRRLRREARLAEFRLLFIALGFVTVALSAVSLFGNRVEQAMQLQTGALLGADGVLVSTRPIDEDFDALARSLGLRTARTVNFLSMAVAPGGSRLARIKAVSPGYPLRGAVVTRAPGTEGEGVEDVPLTRGSAWVAASLARDDALAGGESLSLGNGRFEVTREVVLEPEGALGSFSIAPRVMIALEDLDATGLLTPASRAQFQLLVAGPVDAIESFAAAVADRLSPNEQWHAADLERDEVQATVGRVVSYLNLAVLLSVVLGVVAMAVAAQGLWRRQAHAGALIRCLGASHARAIREQAALYLIAAVPVGIAGTGLGALLQHVASAGVARAAGIELPAPTLAPALGVVAAAVVTVLAVMVPFLVAQRRVPVVVLLRSSSRDRLHAGAVGVGVVGVLVAVFSLFLAGDVVLAGSVLAGLALAGAVFWLLVRGVIGALAAAVPSRASAWAIALRSLASNARRSAWLASAFGAAVFALVLLGAVRGDLFDAWSDTVPDDAPDVFLVNIQPDRVDAVRELLAARNVPHERFYPIFRARLSAIDGEAVSESDFDSESARHRVNHEFNLTEDGELPDGNRLVAGTWFAAGERGLSVERETAESLGLAVGSRLTFDVAGTRVEAPVANIRTVRWDSMKPNFFVLGSPGLFADAPRSYITAAVAGGDVAGLSRALNERFPAVTLIDLGLILGRLRQLVDQGSAAVSVVFVFTLAAALLVLVAMLQGQREARRREIALLKTLGASRARIRTAVLAEFGVLGGAAGAVGGALALASGWLLARYVFGFDFQPAWQWVALSLFGGAILVGAGGYLSIRSLVAVAPTRLLAG